MENSEPEISHLSPVSQRGVAIYREKLKSVLEPEHNGEAVAIHVGTGDYVVARSQTEARRTLLKRHKPDGQIVTLTIGPPTPTDIDMAARFLTGQKQ
jgi:hypothetical protein